MFYTNSRYAKVGGLPPHELNQLELQFLLLNNFTLMIPPEEMQRYGDRLLAYWQGREQESGSDSASMLVEERARTSSREASKDASSKEASSREASASTNIKGDTTPTSGPSNPPTTVPPAPPAEQPRPDAMEVDERPQLQRQTSSTVPGTPSHPSASSSSSGQLTRSASVPRRPTGDVPMRPPVSFAPSVQRDNAVGVGL